MYTVLLSGGSGKRLWPLSNDLRSKQYIKLIHRETKTDENCSMIQRVWEQLGQAGLVENSIICASAGQVEIIKSQLGEVNIAIEPDRRDTFPAVALSCAYLKSRLHASDDDVVTVLPVDPYTEAAYFETIKSLEQVLLETDSEITLMGAKPHHPSGKLGYIVPKEAKDGYVLVDSFKEKPDEAEAARLISRGALWNCGVFCFKLGRILDIVRQYGIDPDYDRMYRDYDKLPKISFDYEVVERAGHLTALEFSGLWEDLGTWNSLTGQMSGDTVGHVIKAEDCRDTKVINELDVPVVTLGTESMVVVASLDGILVADKEQSVTIKDVLKDVKLQPMYEERRWGTIKVLDMDDSGEEKTLTRKITIFAGKTSSYHHHSERTEIWTVVKGKAELILDGIKLSLVQGSSVCIQKNQKHGVRALSDFEYIEIHIGKKVGNEDINRITFDWDEIESYLR